MSEYSLVPRGSERVIGTASTIAGVFAGIAVVSGSFVRAAESTQYEAAIFRP